MKFRLILALAVMCCLPKLCDALTINTVYMAPGEMLPSVGLAGGAHENTVGGGSLAGIVRAAADAWEELIHDDFTTTISFGWYPTGSTSALAYHRTLTLSPNLGPRLIDGTIVFNSLFNTSAPLFMDPTPSTSEEFIFSQQSFIPSDDGPIEIQRDSLSVPGIARGARDLYSVALHEIGHGLGLNFWAYNFLDTLGGTINVNIEPYENVVINSTAAHLDLVGPVMSSTGIGKNIRRDISQIDLLAACTLSQFEECQLDVRPTDAPGDFDGNGVVNAKDFLAWQRGQSPSPMSQDDLEIWKDNYSPARLSAPSAVPEPASLSLLTIAMWVGVLNRRPSSISQG